MSFGKNVVAMKFLHMLMTPFESTDAFKLGIIDRTGEVIKKPETPEERDSYSLLERVVFSLKRMLGKVPGGQTQIASLAAALYLVKEGEESLTCEQIELKLQKLIRSNYCLVEEELEIQRMYEEVSAGGIAANNTAGVEVKNPDAIPKKKKTTKDFIRRNSKIR